MDVVVWVGGVIAVWMLGLGRGQGWILFGLGEDKVVVVVRVRGGGYHCKAKIFG